MALLSINTNFFRCQPIENAFICNVINENDRSKGQAAMFAKWESMESPSLAGSGDGLPPRPRSRVKNVRGSVMRKCPEVYNEIVKLREAKRGEDIAKRKRTGDTADRLRSAIYSRQARHLRVSDGTAHSDSRHRTWRHRLEQRQPVHRRRHRRNRSDHAARQTFVPVRLGGGHRGDCIWNIDVAQTFDAIITAEI